MKFLYSVRNRIESLFRKYERPVTYCLRFVAALLVLWAASANCGYNTLLSQWWFILAFSIVCAFVDLRIMTLIIAVYVVAQYLSLSLGIGIFLAAVLLILYLLYFRLEKRYGIMLLIIPVLYVIKIPAAATLVLAATAPMSAVIAVICGNVAYYVLHFINLNATVITGFTDVTEFDKVSFVTNGIVNYKEFMYMILIMILVFMITYYLKKLNVNHPNETAIALSTGILIILQLLANLAFESMTYAKLWTIIIGGAVSMVVAFIMSRILLPIDYARTELAEFEDEEYYYFLKAVPKASIDKEVVNITRINSRKKNTKVREFFSEDPEQETEDDKA